MELIKLTATNKYSDGAEHHSNKRRIKQFHRMTHLARYIIQDQLSRANTQFPPFVPVHKIKTESPN